ncbi:MAG: O-antigen ligase family protein, partial [Pseudomonadota bacterium]
AYLIVVGLTVLNWRKMTLGIAAVWPITALLLLVWFSIFWSVDPDTTQRRAIALTITSLMGVYLFVRFDFNDMLRFLAYCYAVLIAIGFAYVAVFPEFAIHSDGDHAGSFRGAFFHKNGMGRQLAFAMAIFFAAWYAQALSRPVVLTLITAALLGIVATTSKTALIALFILLPGLIAVHMVRGAALRSAVITLSILAIVWHVALLLYFTYEDILLFLGRDPSLTGRTKIWEFVLRLGMDVPFTGYGYDAFWSGDYSPGAPFGVAWGIGSAHNAWLEVFVALGLPGVLLLVGIIASMIFRGIVLARYYAELAPSVLIVLCTFLYLTIGASESLLMLRHTSFWMIFIAIAGCARALTARLSKQHEEAANDQLPAGPPVYGARPI